MGGAAGLTATPPRIKRHGRGIAAPAGFLYRCFSSQESTSSQTSCRLVSLSISWRPGGYRLGNDFIRRVGQIGRHTRNMNCSGNSSSQYYFV